LAAAAFAGPAPRAAAQSCPNPTWGQVTTIGAPTGRADYAMAYDSARDKILLFGGTDGTQNTNFSDTWEYDPAAPTPTWTLLSPATTPPARSGHGMVYDSARQRIVMFGGKPDGST